MASTPRAGQIQHMHDLSEADFHMQLRANGKFKERSSNTHDMVHCPALDKAIPDGSIKCVLLGTSMVERFKNTGRNEKFG